MPASANLPHDDALRTLGAGLAQLIAHVGDLRSIGQRSDAHPMHGLAAPVFGDDEGVDEAVRLQGVDELHRVATLRESAACANNRSDCPAGDGCAGTSGGESALTTAVATVGTLTGAAAATC